MVSALVSGNIDRNIALFSWTKHFTLTVRLSTQVYKMGTGEFNAGDNPEIGVGGGGGG